VSDGLSLSRLSDFYKGRGKKTTDTTEKKLENPPEWGYIVYMETRRKTVKSAVFSFFFLLSSFVYKGAL